MPTRVLIAYVLIALVILAIGWAAASFAQKRKRQRDLRSGRHRTTRTSGASRS